MHLATFAILKSRCSNNAKKKASTHILFKGVATNSKTSESSFRIGDWRVVLAEDIKASNDLPVKITVELIERGTN